MKTGLYIGGMFGAVLLMTSLVGSMFIAVQRIPVETWTPFVLAGISGFLILNRIVQSDDPVMKGLGLLCGAGAFLGAVFGAMIISVSPELQVSTWKPFIWSAIAGFLLYMNSIPRRSSQQASGTEQSGNDSSDSSN